MKSKGRSWKERICALALAVVLVLTGILPDAALTVSAAEGVTRVEFAVQDADNSNVLLSDLTVVVKDNSGTVVGRAETPNEDGKYVIEDLKSDTTYTYEITKSGYDYADVAASRDITPNVDDPDANQVIVNMNMSDIAVDVSNLNLIVRDTQTIQVTNPIAGATYMWASEDESVATVEEGTVTAIRAGNTTVKVSYNNKITSIPVVVSKTDFGNLGLTVGLNVLPTSGNDQSVVECQITGIPDDASGNVKFYINDNEEGQIDIKETKTWSFSGEGKIIGTLTFRAEYPGDDKYEPWSSDPVSASYTKTKELEFEDASAKKVIRDDVEENKKTFDIKLKSESIGERNLTFKSNNTEVATVDETGKVTAVKAGRATITVSAEANTNYSAATKTYDVVVQKVIDVSKDSLVWGEYTKIYDGQENKTVPLTASLEGDFAVVGATGVKAEFQAEVADANVGTKSATLKNDTPVLTCTEGKDLSELYIFENYENVEISEKVVIKSRPVYIGTNDETVSYGQDLEAAVNDLQNVLYILEKDDESGVVEEDTIDISKEAAKLKTIDSTSAEIKEYKNEILPDISDEGKVVGNYTLYPASIKKDASGSSVYGENKYGTLTVEEEYVPLGTIFDRINVTSGLGTGVYQNGQKIYVRGINQKALGDESGATLRISVIDKTYYDTVFVEWEGETEPCNLTDGYTIIKNPSEPLVGKIYLQNSKTGVTTKKDGGSGFKVCVDAESPEVSFINWQEKTRISDGLTQAITFNRYSKSIYSVNVEKVDLPTDEQASGANIDTQIASWSYHVIRKSPELDGKYKEITADEIYQNKDSYEWTRIESDGEYTIPVAVEEAGKSMEDYYVVLVKVSDNVGNTAIYSSNGLVVDIQEPSVTITDTDDNAFVEGKIYNDSVDYKVNITDYKETGTKEKPTSGIKNYCVTVKKDDTKTFDSGTLEVGKDTEVYTINDLKSLVVENYLGIVDADENNSNNVIIHVDAVDQAENALNNGMGIDQLLMIDKTDPKINVSYVNNDVKNDKYFKAKRIMKITFTERNFDKEKVTFDIKVGSDISKEKIISNQKVSDLAKYGIKADWISDMQNGKDISEYDVTQYEDSREIKLELTFDKDNEYYIVPHCEDNAGNTNNNRITYDDGTVAPKEFVIDTKSPVINSVVYTDANGNVILVNENTRTYTQSSVTATISITEKNFWLSENEFSTVPEQLDFSATQETEVALKNALTTADYRKIAAGNSWYNVGEAGTTITFEPDANYTFGFTYTDLAGNEATYAPHYFTVDKTQPNGTISIDDQSVWDIVWKVLTFDIFKNSTYNITLTSDDYTAGVASTAYYKTAQPISEAQVKALPDGKDGWTEGTSFTVSPNEQYVVYGRVIDKAGNVRYIYPTRGAVADNAAPEITITNLTASQNGIHYGDVTLRVDVTDPTAGDTYSGLEKVWYEVNSTGNKVNSETKILVNNENNRVQGSKDYSGNIVIPAADFDSNDVKVQVHAVDFSGNEYHSEIVPLKIDITPPTIQVTYDLNSPSNGKYYNQTRTATVTVTERNFDPNNVRFNITNTDGTQPSISGWSSDGNAGVLDSALNTCTVSFAADGDYTFTLNCTDLAGNESNYTQVDEFTIDKTVPTINVSFDNNNASNGSYYNAPRTATITVNEHNFNGSEVQTAISASLQSQGISAPGVNGWSTSGDTHTATVYFSADGDYSFTVNYTDLAGNAATAYNVDKFTIDQTKPTVEIFDIADKSANNGTVAPGVRYSDVNYNTAGVNITIMGVEHKAVSLDGARSLIPNGESIKMADFAHEPSVDDIYTLTARVTDLAGNSDEKSVIFSVNRFGSTYRYSKATKKLLYDDYYTNQEQDLVVEEINVDTLEHYGISYGRDGELVNLEKGTDYTVKESGNEVSWKSYLYTIKAKNFEKEGLYDVTIDSRDRATNEVNNKVKNTPIEFVIDKTAPTIVITGLEKETDANGNVKEQRYTQSSRDINIAYEDNVAMGEIAIYKDDIALEGPWTDEKALKQVDEIPITIESSTNWQKLRAVAVDAAGNTAETSEYRVLITSNLLVQFYRNTPLVIGSSISLLAVIAVIILLIGKRKKKEEEEA